MGHIKEPEGVDLTIKSRTLTKEEETKISDYIRAYKMKHSGKQKEKVVSKRKKRELAD